MNIRESILRKIIVFVVVAAIAVPFITPEIFAASKVSITGGDNVKAGETFVLTVAYTGGGEVGRVDGQLEYDTDSLSYISGGDSTGDTGYVQLNEAGIDGIITFSVKFKALNGGSTNVKVSTNNMYDLDERAMDTPSTSKSIIIKGSSSVGSDDNDRNKDKETSSLIPTDKVGSSSSDEALGGDGKTVNTMPMLIIIAAILVVLIVIIVVVLKKKRR